MQQGTTWVVIMPAYSGGFLGVEGGGGEKPRNVTGNHRGLYHSGDAKSGSVLGVEGGRP